MTEKNEIYDVLVLPFEETVEKDSLMNVRVHFYQRPAESPGVPKGRRQKVKEQNVKIKKKHFPLLPVIQWPCQGLSNLH